MDKMDKFDINDTNQMPIKPKVKTIYLDASGNMGRGAAFLGTAFLFLCIFAVCLGLAFCVIDSFKLDVSLGLVAGTLFFTVLFCTLIYFLPSRIFTLLAFLLGAGGLTLYAATNYDILQAAYYTLNLCLYRIQEEGYRIGGIVDNQLAERSDAIVSGYLNITVLLVCVLIAVLFSYLVYSKKNVAYSLLVSVAVVFPGFFYGLIPSYLSFSLVAAFWVSHFALNMFESNRMAYAIERENTIPEKKLAKLKLKEFKQQYKKNIASIKTEIKTIVKSPNRHENSIRLNRLVRRLGTESPNEWLFLTFYGLNNLTAAGTSKNKKAKPGEAENVVRRKKNNWTNPIKAEKKRLVLEANEKIAAEKSARQAEKKEFAKNPLSKRLEIRFAKNIKNKKRFSAKSGYAAIFAFVVAFFAVWAVSPFISPTAKFDLSMPEKVMDFLTSTVEYTLVGSDSSVYGGYNGGMGGGFLYRPGGAKFKDKPILKITSATDTSTLYLKSGAIYLKGWTGTIYTGNMWLEADKKQIEAYDALASSSPLPRFNYVDEQDFFWIFTESMQNIFAASYQRRGAELKDDKIKIEHLVAGGKRSFLPCFYASYGGDRFNFKENADLYVQITNSLFRYPIYTTEFYSVDNVLNRASIPVDDMKEYLAYYNYISDTSVDIERFFSLSDPPELQQSMPDMQFFSASQFRSMSERRFDTLLEEGTFYEYLAPSLEFSAEPQYSGYVFIPGKYNDVIDIIKVRHNIYAQSGVGGFINSDYIDSEVLYSSFAKKYYLYLPPDFPEEVHELAKEITKGLSNDYEKALAIEQYLAQNHTYTLNPITPTDTRADFVYNFLFDQKEGYCTAYASAMVTMLRSLGIPARYAEGYLVDTSKKLRDETGKEYIIIYDYNGHAWPEVYFRGIGWLPFEPTVSYSEEEEAEAAYIYNPPVRLPSYEGPIMPTEPEEEEDEEDLALADKSLPFAFWAILAVLIVCGLVYLLNIAINSSRFSSFKTAGTNAAILKMLSYLLAFLKHCGFAMHNEEGLREFAARVAPNFLMIRPEGWEQIAEIMQKARYSSHEMTEDERADAFDFIEALLKECKKQLKFNLKFKLRYVYFVL